MIGASIIGRSLRRNDSAAWRAVAFVVFTTAFVCSALGALLGLFASTAPGTDGAFRADTAAMVTAPAASCSAADVETRLHDVDASLRATPITIRRAAVDGAPTLLVGRSLTEVMTDEARPHTTDVRRVEGLAYSADTDVARSDLLAAVVVDDDVLQRIAGSERVPAIAVTGAGSATADISGVAAGCGWLASNMDAVGRDLGIVEAPDLAGALEAVSTIIGFVVLLAVVVLSSLMALVTVHMLPALAVVRAVGASRVQTVRLHLQTFLGAAVIPTIVGLVCGVPASWGLFTFLHRTGVVDPRVAWHLGFGLWAGVLLSGLAVLVVAVLSGSVSMRRVWTCAPSDALRPPRRQRSSRTKGRLIGGLILIAASATMIMPMILLDRVSGAMIGFSMVMLLAPITALLAPWIVLPLARLVGAGWAVVDRRLGRLVAADIKFYDGLIVSVGTPVLVAVALVSTLFGLQPTLRAAYEYQGSESALGVVSRAPAIDFGDALIREQIPGADTPDGADWTVVGVPSAMLAGGLLDPGATSGTATGLEPDGFAASASLAGKRGWAVGERYSVPLPDGSTQTLTMRFTYDRDLIFGQMLMPNTTVAAASYAPYSAARLVTAAGRDGSSASLGDLSGRGQVEVDPSSALVIAVLVVYCAAALSGSIVLGIYGRKSALHALRRQGTTRTQRTTRLIVEVTSAVAAAAVIAVLVSLFTLLPTAALGAGVTTLRLSAWTWVVSVGAVIVAAAATVIGYSSVEPVRRVARPSGRRDSGITNPAERVSSGAPSEVRSQANTESGQPPE
ncbi:hypothetical protein [Prescottella agglutinans]|uniref:hypothetical protein n=1 Tax=Prescottella agglutinans TaxID=1644129 RepID=UPI003D995421